MLRPAETPLSRRTFLCSAALAISGLARPTAGIAADPELAPFDQLMSRFVTDHKVPGGSLAVTRRGKLVYARGFGYADVDAKLPVRPVSLFRIASVSKPLTAVAVLQLVDQGKVNLDDPILKHIRLKPHHAPEMEPDRRWDKITVQHCLQHTGGWDRDKSFDPIGIPGVIATALKTKPPVPPSDVIRYMMGQPLDFDPGTRHAYSNLGYLLLGRVIEAASGEKYEAYVRKHVLAPLGVTAARLGRALPEDRRKDEVRYYDARQATGPCLYAPRVGEQVPIPDGAANFEAYEAHGGWVASAVDLARFASAFDNPAACPILSAAGVRTMWSRPAGRAGFTASGRPKASYYGCGWQVARVGPDGAMNTWHNGLISGTSSLLVRRADGLNWVVLFNTDRDRNGTRRGRTLSEIIDPLIHEAADEVKQWPDGDLFDRYRSET